MSPWACSGSFLSRSISPDKYMEVESFSSLQLVRNPDFFFKKEKNYWKIKIPGSLQGFVLRLARCRNTSLLSLAFSLVKHLLNKFAHYYEVSKEFMERGLWTWHRADPSGCGSDPACFHPWRKTMAHPHLWGNASSFYVKGGKKWTF